jgi:hypothetical protein
MIAIVGQDITAVLKRSRYVILFFVTIQALCNSLILTQNARMTSLICERSTPLNLKILLTINVQPR